MDLTFDTALLQPLAAEVYALVSWFASIGLNDLPCHAVQHSTALDERHSPCSCLNSHKAIGRSPLAHYQDMLTYKGQEYVCKGELPFEVSSPSNAAGNVLKCIASRHCIQQSSSNVIQYNL